MTQAAARYNEALPGTLVLSYLEDRGIDLEMANQYLLGAVSEPDPSRQQFEGRLAIPFRTPSGVVSIRYRCVLHEDCKAHGCVKYLQAKGEGDHLFNALALHERHPALAISEGEIDCLFVDTHVMPCIGVTGATKWKPYWGRVLLDYERVFVLGDGDKAGREFCDKLAELLPNAQPVVFPDGCDVNQYYLEHGPDALSDFVLGTNK